MKLAPRQQPKEGNVNITSLMDCLTIILVFLIYNVSSEEVKLEPPEGFELPPSSAEKPVKMSVRVSIAPDALKVGEEVVAQLADGRAPKKLMNRAKHIVPLLKALKRHKAQMQMNATPDEASEDEDEDEIVLVEAGKTTAYRMLHRVMQTAAAAGFTKFRLAVVRSS